MATLGWEVLELYNDVVRQRGREAGVLVIDLAREMPKNSAYYYDLMHYTNAGAALVADIVAAQLTPFLAKKFPAYYQGPSRPKPLDASSPCLTLSLLYCGVVC